MFLNYLWVNALALIIDLVLTALLIQPLCTFLVYGWKRKQEEVNNSLTSEAKRSYLEVFWNQTFAEGKTPKEKSAINRQIDQEFSDLYQRQYGRNRFITPILILFVIAGFENFYLSNELIQLLANNAELSSSVAAIAGAYAFVTWDFFGRVQRRNLVTADILRGALRMAVAVPVGFAFAALIAKGLAPFIAFAVGVFPLDTIKTILRRLANDKLKLELGADTAPDQVATLSGVDRSIADRIEDADITTIPQLAWCDPIQLSMRSSLAFDYVVDIVSQALAWVYLSDKLPVLKTFGLRGAYEMKVLSDDLASTDPAVRAKAEAVLPAAATAADIPLPGLMYALEQIAEDPATRFLYDAS
jgi:hypothetical protein